MDGDLAARADIRLVMPLIEKTDQIIALAELKWLPISDRVIGTTLDRYGAAPGAAATALSPAH